VLTISKKINPVLARKVRKEKLLNMFLLKIILIKHPSLRKKLLINLNHKNYYFMKSNKLKRKVKIQNKVKVEKHLIRYLIQNKMNLKNRRVLKELRKNQRERRMREKMTF